MLSRDRAPRSPTATWEAPRPPPRIAPPPRQASGPHTLARPTLCCSCRLMAPKKERKQTAANGKGTGSKKAGTAAAPARGRKAAPKRKQAGAKAAQPGAERPSKKAKSVEAGEQQRVHWLVVYGKATARPNWCVQQEGGATRTQATSCHSTAVWHLSVAHLCTSPPKHVCRSGATRAWLPADCGAGEPGRTAHPGSQERSAVP